MRQLVEQVPTHSNAHSPIHCLFKNGFYRTGDKAWVTLERIQFVGACNPPTDPGRNPLSPRFLRHVPVVYVDYPGSTSLKQIYGTFNRAMLRPITLLRGMAEPLTEAMVDFYLQSQVLESVIFGRPHCPSLRSDSRKTTSRTTSTPREN